MRENGEKKTTGVGEWGDKHYKAGTMGRKTLHVGVGEWGVKHYKAGTMGRKTLQAWENG